MSVDIRVGDALSVLRTLPSESVQLVCTSPPYFALRDYGVDGQIGLEPTPAEFIAALMAVFDEVRRVLRPDGVCFVNLGDSYAGSGKGPTGHNGLQNAETRQGFASGYLRANGQWSTGGRKSKTEGVAGIPAKNLLLIPERFAIAMQDAGWYVRQQIVWSKASCMPESVRDRFTSAWEPIWMFTKSARYFFDQEAVREPLKQPDVKVPQGFGGNKRNGGTTYSGNPYDASQLGGANMRNVWHLSPEPSKEAHYASFPTEIPRRCILAGTSERGACPKCGAPWRRVVERSYVKSPVHGTGSQMRKRSEDTNVNGWAGMPRVALKTSTTSWTPGCACSRPAADAPYPARPCLVLDPFLGSGTTALVAHRLGRSAIGIELNESYARLAEARIQRDVGPMFPDEVQVSGPVQSSIFDAIEAAG